MCASPGARLNEPSDEYLALPNGMLTQFKDVNTRLIRRHTNSPHHKRVKKRYEENKAKIMAADMQQIVNEKLENILTNMNFRAGGVSSISFHTLKRPC